MVFLHKNQTVAVKKNYRILNQRPNIVLMVPKNINFVNVRLVYYFPYSLFCQFFCSKKQACKAGRDLDNFPC